MQKVFSIGHSSHPWGQFTSLLERNGVGCVVDVRSRPRSRWTAYCHPNFRIKLNERGVSYIFMGDVLGGQPTTGPTGYSAIAVRQDFLEGIQRVIAIAKRCKVALVCSEHDPLQCHRFLLISRALAAYEVDVQHILRDGQVEGHAAALRRLQRSLPSIPLFGEEDNHAYDAQEARLNGREP